MLERLKQHPKNATALLIVMLVMSLLTGILWPSGSGIVHAESINVNYDKDIWDGYDYSKYPSLAPTNTVAKAGYKIKSLKVVNYMNNQLIQTISAAEGQTSYTFSGILFSGIRTKVMSKKNGTTQGYYAWYRYAKGTNGNNWHANFARVDDSYNEYGDSRTSKSSSLDSYGMPEHPGTTDTNLSLTGVREKEFYTDGNQWVDTRYISHDELTGSAIVNGDDEIGGPPGEGITGKTKPATISINKVDTFPDLNRIIVRYAQDFNYVEDNFKPLAAYGAALMVYFSAFTVDLESYTYHYPYKLDVEWEPIGSPTPSGGTVTPTPTPTTAPTLDDLEVVSLSYAPTAFTARDDVTFTYVFKNNSNRAWSNFYYSIGGTHYLFTGTLPVGGSHTSSLTRKIDSPFTLTVKIDSRNEIPEFNEANNEKTVTAIPNAVADNDPPEGRLRWFYHGTERIADTVVEGTPVDLKYMDVKDPDNDPVGYRMNFSDWNSTFYKTYMTNRYTSGDGYDAFTNISTVGAVGYHIARGRLVDPYGGYTDLSTSLTVIPPNPVAMCEVPSTTKSRRPLAAGAINANKSYSPLDRAIDHGRDEWTNNLPFYINDTDADTTETVILEKVYDNTGLASLNRDACSITVKPDLPPIAKVVAPALGIRGEDFDIMSESHSPDGDPVVEVLWYIRYDANNDGVFNDITEPWTAITGTPSKYVFRPANIGKYQFKIKVKEDYGKEAEAVSGIMDVINLAPEVSFDLSGNNPNPDQNIPQMFTGETIKNTWDLYRTNTNVRVNRISDYLWQTANGGLSSGAGKNNESYKADFNVVGYPSSPAEYTFYNSPLNDNGWGRNGISIYKAFSAVTPGYSQPLRYPTQTGEPGNPVSATTKIASDKLHLFVGDQSASVYALNKTRIPKYTTWLETTAGPGYFTSDTRYKWEGPSPYDFVIDSNDIPSNILSTRTVPYYNQIGNVVKYSDVKDKLNGGGIGYVAGPYIYYTFNIGVPYRVNESTDEDDYTYSYPLYETQPYGCSFNSSTGALIACFKLPGESSNGKLAYENNKYFVKGNNLVSILDNSNKDNGYFGLIQHEFDYKGNTVKIGYNESPPGKVDYVSYEKKYSTWLNPTQPMRYDPPQYSVAGCYYMQQLDTIPASYRDAEGNYYVYESRSCKDGSVDITPGDWNNRAYPELGLGIWIAKYNSEFKLQWRTKTRGTHVKYDPPFSLVTNNQHNIGTMIINSLNGSLISKSFYVTSNAYSGNSGALMNDLIDLQTGASQAWTGSPVQGMSSNVRVDAWGNYTTGEGAYNIYGQNLNIDHGKNHVLASTANIGSTSKTYLNRKVQSELVGDGLLLTSYQTAWEYGGGGFSNWGSTESVWWIDIGEPVDAPEIQPRYNFGQFISPISASDSEFAFSFNVEQAKVDNRQFGYSFRMQDGMNRYVVEFDGNNISLSKYLGGVRHVLATNSYNLQDSKDYSLKIRIVGDKLSVWVNKVPYFVDVVDGSFSSGRFGPFSDKSFVTFKGISHKVYQEANIWGSDFAILDEAAGVAQLNYDNINFIDPEHDPMSGSFFWQYTHSPMFLNNGGVSPLNGSSHNSGLPTFDRVGRWEVSLMAKDDPAPEPGYRYPDMTFDGYRKNSNSFKRTITVHRRPVSVFNPALNGNTVTWNDSSYDPDRFDINTGYAEPGYAANRGGFERRHIAISPSGVQYNYMVTSLDEKGIWTLGLQVKDEFGAWSFLETAQVEVAKNANRKPSVILTNPTGTEDSPTYLPVNVNPTITWTRSDPDPDTLYTAYELVAESIYTGGWGGVSISERISGAKAELTKEVNGSFFATQVWGSTDYKYRVKIRVKDETEWSDWSNVGWFSSILPPSATLTFPLGTQDNPTYVPTLRPTITWDQNDPNASRIMMQEINVWNENGTLFSNQVRNVAYADYAKTADSWQLNTDVPMGAKMRVTVRVKNSANVWSPWSNSGWFITNRPPAASMAVPDGSESAPTMFNTLRPTFVWYQTDPDPGTVFTSFQIQVTNAVNTVTLLDSGEYWQNTSATTGSWQASADLPAGQKLRVRVRVFDGHVWSDWSSQTWFYINRAPVADFDWSPKPVWEGDAVRLTSLSYDPDGDALTYRWHIVSPSGQESGGSLAEWTGVWAEPGGYRVTLIVSDGLAEASAQKTVEVLPLTIGADILHTPEWLQYHVERGHETAHAPKDFYAGEKLLLHVTSAPAPVRTAEAYLEATGIGGDSIRVQALLSAGSMPTLFEGELYDPVMGSLDNRLPDGLHEVHFRLVYSNGVVKETTVPFRIIGSALGAVGVHRVQ